MEAFLPSPQNNPHTLDVKGVITGLDDGADIVIGKGFTATKTGTGTYRIVTRRKFKAAVCIPVHGSSSAAALYAQFISYDVATSAINIRIVNGSGAATNGGATDTLSFSITLLTSGLPIK